MASGPAGSSAHAAEAGPPRDLRSIALLLLLAAAIHGWLIWHTDLPASDSINFIRYAWRLHDEPWAQVLRTSNQHPGYPALILAVAIPLCKLAGAATCQTVLLSAQLANAIAGCVVVVPMFYLGRSLFDRRVGFWAAALFQCLPAFARASADALSEGPFLLFAALTLYFAVRIVRQGFIRHAALCGLCGGLAYLVRPEGALCVLAAGLVLVAMQFHAGLRRPWRKALPTMACLGLAALATVLPYMLTIGRLTSKPTANKLLDVPLRAPELTATADARLLACTLAVWWEPHDHPAWHSLLGVTRQLLRAGHVLAVLFVPVGLWWYRQRADTSPDAWLLWLTAALQMLMVWRVAFSFGYAAERHMLLILMCLLFWAVAALVELPGRLMAAHERAVRWSVALLVLVLATCLPKSLQPLHAERLGHRAAGHWLAEHAGPADVIVDPFSWSYYYSGRLFDGMASQRVPSAGQACYVVMDCAKDLHGQVDAIEQVALALLPHGKLVFDWRPQRGANRRASEIQVYFVPKRSAPEEDRVHVPVWNRARVASQ